MGYTFHRALACKLLGATWIACSVGACSSHTTNNTPGEPAATVTGTSASTGTNASTSSGGTRAGGSGGTGAGTDNGVGGSAGDTETSTDKSAGTGGDAAATNGGAGTDGDAAATNGGAGTDGDAGSASVGTGGTSGGGEGGSSGSSTATSSATSGGTGGTSVDPCEDRLGESDCPAESCLDLLLAGVGEDGSYWIDPSGTNPFEIYCDQTTDGGGWGLVWTNHGGAKEAARSNAQVFSQTGARIVLPPEQELVSAKHDEAFDYYFARPGLEWLKRGVGWDETDTIVRSMAIRVDMDETSMQDVFDTAEVDLEGDLDESVLLMETGACHRMPSPMEVFVEGQSLGSTDWVFRYNEEAYGLAHVGPNAEPNSQCGEDVASATNLIRANDELPSGNTLSTLRMDGGGSSTINSLFSYEHLQAGPNASRCFFECWDDGTLRSDAFVWAVR